MNETAIPVPAAERHPFVKLMQLLGRRWALRVIHELYQAPSGFRALASRCDGMSSSVLSTRLAELRSAGIVREQDGQPYALTPRGQQLAAHLVGLSDWAVGMDETLPGSPSPEA